MPLSPVDPEPPPPPDEGNTKVRVIAIEAPINAMRQITAHAVRLTRAARSPRVSDGCFEISSFTGASPSVPESKHTHAVEIEEGGGRPSTSDPVSCFGTIDPTVLTFVALDVVMQRDGS